MAPDNIRLRYVSIAALVVHPQGTKFLLARRIPNEPFKPGHPVFPSARIERNERTMERLHQVITEQTHLPYDRESVTYIGDCTFLREDAYPVLQLCFAARALHTEARHGGPIHDLRWSTIDDLARTQQTEYLQNLYTFVEGAMKKGLLGRDIT